MGLLRTPGGARTTSLGLRRTPGGHRVLGGLLQSAAEIWRTREPGGSPPAASGNPGGPWRTSSGLLLKCGGPERTSYGLHQNRGEPKRTSSGLHRTPRVQYDSSRCTNDPHPPTLQSPPLGGDRHFDSRFFPLCSLVLPMLVPPVRVDTSLHSDTNVCHVRSCDICKEHQIPKQLKVPVKSKPAKPAPKRAGKRPAQSICASSSNPQPVPEMPTEHVQEFRWFGLVKRSFKQCLWKGHRSNMNA